MPNFVLASGLSFVSSRPLGFRNPSSIEDTNVARPPKAPRRCQALGGRNRRKSRAVCQTESSHNGVRCQGRHQALRRRAALLGGPSNPMGPMCTRCFAWSAKRCSAPL